MRLLRLGRWAALYLLASASLANAADPLTAAQQDAVRQIVRDFLLKNPEVLVDALQAYQEKAKAEAQQQQQAALAQLRVEIERDPTSPVIGAADGDVTVVEFLDYRCTYCKKVFPAVQDLLRTDGRIRYVIKEFPILSPESELAAKASLAVWRKTPDKYMAFHTALMTARGNLTDTRILELAGEAGLDPKAVAAAMKDPELNAILAKTHALAQALGIQGTPAFIVGKHLAPGAVSVDALREMVAEARKK